MRPATVDAELSLNIVRTWEAVELRNNIRRHVLSFADFLLFFKCFFPGKIFQPFMWISECEEELSRSMVPSPAE